MEPIYIVIATILAALLYLIIVMTLMNNNTEENLTVSLKNILVTVEELIANEEKTIITLRNSIEVYTTLSGTPDDIGSKMLLASENTISKLKLLKIVYTDTPVGWESIANSLIRAVDKEQFTKEVLSELREAKINLRA